MTKHPPAVAAFGTLVGCAPTTQQLFEQLRRIAATDSTVLIEGETGTGKGLIAHEIVRHGSRADRALVTVECDGIPSDVELQLFGRDRDLGLTPLPDLGAFAQADGGTLILDEVAALPMTAQARLVRILDSGILRRAGDPPARGFDVRILALTREDLQRRCERRQFRRDLYFCLRALRVRVPPLRERFADLPLLVDALAVEEGCLPGLHLDAEFADWLRCRPWPGNLRELRNVLQRVRALGVTAVMTDLDEPPPANVAFRAPGGRALTGARAHLASAEHAYVVRLLRRHAGNVAQAARAARRSSGWLRRRIRHHRIDLNAFRAAAPDGSAGPPPDRSPDRAMEEVQDVRVVLGG
jgi:DNA-binding NtrC family response regulator